MKTVTYKEFLKFKPCWLEEEGGAERIKTYFNRFGGRMSALDILKLDDVSAKDKLWSVLREEFIPVSILHEFACVCAEYALSLIENPDPRSVNAIKVKRAWISGETTDAELNTVRTAAWCVYDAARATAYDAAYEAAARAVASAISAAAAYTVAVETAAWAAEVAWYATYGDAAYNTAWAAEDAACIAWDAIREAQVAYLIMALEG